MSAVLGLCYLFDMANRMSVSSGGPAIVYDQISAPHTDSTQQYDAVVVPPNLTHKDATIRDLQLWMEGQVEADLSVPAVAARAGLSSHTLQRRFARGTGLSLTQYVQELRVENARRMLERTGLPISEICWRVGYSDVSAFSRLFKSVSGLSARHYRRRFSVT